MERSFWINHMLNINCVLCWFPCKYTQKPQHVYLTRAYTIRIANILNVGLEAVPAAVYEARFNFSWEKEYFSPLQEASEHNIWFSDTSGGSNVCFQLPGSEWILSKIKTLFCSKFLGNSSGSRTSLGISHSVWLSLLGGVGSGGWKVQMRE